MKNKSEICKNCKDKCCERSYVQLTEEEAEKFKDKIKIIKLNGIYFVDSIEKRCLFLRKDNKCILSYKDRPLSCKLYPIGFILENGRVVVSIDENCPLSKHVNLKNEKLLIDDAVKCGLDKSIAETEDD
ncbi:MAG: YkgJ family cysteine cluster protein [archaeon]|nr:YkgJ family cysteine cluster protein [archaeon]